ncbi:MAG: hypothetical protein ACKO83_02220 [Roseiflexaceae bacterium]
MMRTALALIFGRITPTRIAGILLPGIVAGIAVAVVIGVSTWAHGIAVMATIDIVAGAISNATRATNLQWQRQPRSAHIVFVLVHLIIYPCGLWVLPLPAWLFGCLLGALAVKIGYFVHGSVRTTTSPPQA